MPLGPIGAVPMTAFDASMISIWPFDSPEPIRRGWGTLVMLSSGMPESSRGSSIGAAGWFGDFVSMVTFSGSLVALVLPARSVARTR